MRHERNLGSRTVQNPQKWKVFIFFLFSHYLYVNVRNNGFGPLQNQNLTPPPCDFDRVLNQLVFLNLVPGHKFW